GAGEAKVLPTRGSRAASPGIDRVAVSGLLQLKGGQAGRPLLVAGKGTAAGESVVGDLDGAVDVPWEPETGEAVVERGHFLVDQDFPTGVVDDADVDVLVGQLTAAGGQGVVEAFVGPIDVGGHGQIELTL